MSGVSTYPSPLRERVYFHPVYADPPARTRLVGGERWIDRPRPKVIELEGVRFGRSGWMHRMPDGELVAAYSSASRELRRRG